MAVRQASSVTLYKSGAVTAVTEFHFKASSSSAPAKPTTKTPSAGWYSTVPAWATNTKLYVATRTDLVDGTFLWSDVTEDPTWAAAGAAKAKADRTEQYFYADTSGAHVVSALDSAGKAQGTRLDMSSSGLSIKDANTLSELASFGTKDIYLGNNSTARIHLRNDGLIETAMVTDYRDEQVEAMSVSSDNVTVRAGNTAEVSATGPRPTTPLGCLYDGYVSDLSLSGRSGNEEDEDTSADGSFRLRTATATDAGSPNAYENASVEVYGDVSTYDGSALMSMSATLFHVTENGEEAEDAEDRITFDPGDGGIDIRSDAGMKLSSPDLIAISHSTSGRPPMGVGWGADGNNRGISADINGSGNDGFAWLFAVNDSQHWPIIPGLYHGDVGNCSLIPVYTSQKNLGSIKAGSSTTGTMSISRSGYAPIGVIGTDTSASTYPGHVIANAWVTNRANGSGVLHYAVKNTAASNANTIKITWHVLWARQTDINGTYIS